MGQGVGVGDAQPVKQMITASANRAGADEIESCWEFPHGGHLNGIPVLSLPLRGAGWQVNHKRVERIWRREGLKVPARQPRRGRLWLNDGSCVRLRPERKNHVWACGFVRIRTRDGKAVRLLTVIDEYTRECLAIRSGRSIRSPDVIEALAGLMTDKGIPEHIRSDNGPEFTARAVREWPGGVGGQDPVYRARFSVGERVRGELQRQAQG